jgi:hypothetical protein
MLCCCSCRCTTATATNAAVAVAPLCYHPYCYYNTNSIARVGGAIRIRAPQLATSNTAAAGGFVGSVDHYIHDIKFGSPVPGIEVCYARLLMMVLLFDLLQCLR